MATHHSQTHPNAQSATNVSPLATQTTAQNDIYEQVTQRVIAALETGVKPWVQPWNGGVSFMPQNPVTGTHYSGINILLLWIAQDERGFSSNQWMTYKQAMSVNAQVRKGEKGTKIIFYKTWDREDDSGEIEHIPVIKVFTVFNAEQIDGLAIEPPQEHCVDKFESIEALDRLAESTQATIHHQGIEAFYRPSQDCIVMPPRDAFHFSASYYATLFHELTHWTGHASRCDRNIKNPFGSKDYAFEELVAELGAAFVLAEYGVVGEHIQHENYLADWLKTLRNDKKFIFKAASLASKAHQFINAFNAQPQGATS